MISDFQFKEAQEKVKIDKVILINSVKSPQKSKSEMEEEFGKNER